MIRVVSLNRMEKINDLRDFTSGMFVVVVVLSISENADLQGSMV